MLYLHVNGDSQMHLGLSSLWRSTCTCTICNYDLLNVNVIQMTVQRSNRGQACTIIWAF